MSRGFFSSLSFFHISPHSFTSGFDHRFSFVCSSFSIFDQCLSLISMFCLFYSFVSSPWLLYFSFFSVLLFPFQWVFSFHCTLSLSKMLYRVWTINELISNELTAVLSQSMSYKIAHRMSTVSDSNQNEFTRMLGKSIWKGGGPWLRTGLCNQCFKKIFFK